MIELLSSREMQVVERMAWGESKKEIANNLHVSYNTVDTHCKNVYGKLNVHKASELAALFFSEKYNISRLIITACIFMSVVFQAFNLQPNERAFRSRRAGRQSRKNQSELIIDSIFD